MRASGAAMGKFGKSQSKGVMLASWGNKNYYKGKRVQVMRWWGVEWAARPSHGGRAQKAGVTTRKGGFRLVDAKMPLWEVPDLTGCDLKPYVSRKTPLVSGASAGPVVVFGAHSRGPQCRLPRS